MTAGWVLFLSLVLILLVAQWTSFEEKHRCRYCGVILGHHDHCPYKDIR